MPTWRERRRRDPEGPGDWTRPDDEPEDERLAQLRAHLAVCHCSLVGAWTALIDEVEQLRSQPPETPAVEAEPEAEAEPEETEVVVVLNEPAPQDDSVPEVALEMEPPAHAAAAPRDVSVQGPAPTFEARLLNADSTVTSEGRAQASVWLEANGLPLHGHGVAETGGGGRHVAVARATVDALRAVVGSPTTLESLTLSAHPQRLDAVGLVVTLAAGERRLAGAATAPPDAEDRAAALAVIRALAPELSRTDAATTGSEAPLPA
ncbi:MAG TPA: hypothetical protein VGH10_12900 [Actinomycetota bacterium]|jgi:hypothetical protein